jgi:colicin import membrane protein
MEFKTDAVAVYSEFKAQLAELNELNQSLVFDYADPKQNKEARSHCAKLRKVKTAIEDRRKAAKSDALEYGRQLDGRAKELSAQVDSMIDVHMTHITAIENAEKARIKTVEDFLTTHDVISFVPTVSEIEQRIRYLSEYIVDPNVFLDRTEFAEFRRTTTIALLKGKLAQVKKQIDDQLELEQLRREKELADKQKADDDARARAQAEAQAQAKRKAEDERREADRIEREATEARLADERKRLEDDRRKLEQERAEKDRLDAEEKARADDREHKRSVHLGILKQLEKFGISANVGQAIITAIAKGEIAHVELRY